MPSPVALRRDLRALGGPVAGASLVSALAAAAASAVVPYPLPGSSAARIRAYFQANPGPARLSAAGQLVASAALVPFTLSVCALARRSGSRPLEAAALLGGSVAVTALATSAVTASALTGPAGRRGADAVALHRRAFVAGGPVHTAGFGLLIGALGLAGLRTGEIQRPVATAAVASGAAGVASVLGLAADPLVWLVPAGRLSGLVVAALAGIRLARPPADQGVPQRAHVRRNRVPSVYRPTIDLPL